MKYIEKLLNGAEVKWMPLGEVFETRNGYTPSKANNDFWTNGDIPWFRMEDIRDSGRLLNDSIQHITPQAIKGKGLFRANSIIMATTATIGEHALLLVDALANQQFTNFQIRKSLLERISPMFAFYYFFVLGEWCKSNVNTSSFPSVDMARLMKQLFPIPPLAVQEEIVRILDKFTTLEAELEVELDCRKRQYEYYRNQLLSFDMLKRGGQKLNNVEYKALSEVAEIRRGKRLVKSELSTSGNYAVYQNSMIPLGYYSKSNVSEGTTFVISAGSAGEIGYSPNRFWAADDVYYFVFNDGVCSKYVYYFLLIKQQSIKRQVRRASVPRLSKTAFEKLKIPIPPLAEQQRIVSILDKFEALTTSISEGLPKEIELRRKQYEYYRNQLLSFA